MNPKLIWAGIILGIDLFVKPSFRLLLVVMIAVLIDFITGVIKAWFKKEARTSEGYRKTVVKFMQYVVPVIVLYFGSKRIPEHKELLSSAYGYLLMFIIYIEATSIFENLYEIDKKTVISKYLYRPMLKVLKFGIENNPAVKAADKLKEDEKSKSQQ